MSQLKKAKLRQWAFTVQQASEAFADYIKKTEGEVVGTVAAVNINVDTNQGLLVWTVTDMPQREPEKGGPVIPFPPGGIGGDGTLH